MFICFVCARVFSVGRTFFVNMLYKTKRFVAVFIPFSEYGLT